MIYSLKNKNNFLAQKELKLEIMEICWNSHGLTIACCLGKMCHEANCQDKSYIYVWNISNRNFDPDVPNYVINNIFNLIQQ